MLVQVTFAFLLSPGNESTVRVKTIEFQVWGMGRNFPLITSDSSFLFLGKHSLVVNVTHLKGWPLHSDSSAKNMTGGGSVAYKVLGKLWSL